ncbi:MAG: Hsp70 family protein, partial [Candidatus Parcubacteria bacterium]|nr:Hsp70 family protein [Candidatus Parcubacteria bacterium]
VTFDIDANGILSVTAKDRATNRSQSIKIEGSTGLSKEEIERMTKEAEIHAQEDQKKREASEIKNTADTLIHTAEKALSDAGDKVSADDKKVVEDKIAELRKIKDANDSTEIKAKTEELSKAIQKIGEAMYNQQPQQPENENKDTKGPQEGEYKEKPESPK